MLTRPAGKPLPRRFRMPLSFLALGFLAAALTGCSAKSPDPAASPAFERSVLLLRNEASAPDPTVRANCIEALQLAHDPRALDAIEQGLHDREWVVRFSAAMAAGKRKEASLDPVLRTMCTTDGNESVRVACVYALRRMGDSSQMNLLAKALESKDPSARANTALVLGLLQDPTAIPLLQSHRSEEDIRVRFEITAALARLGDPSAQEVIISWTISKYAEDEWHAMMVCADLPESVAGRPLLMGLKDFPTIPPQYAERYAALTTTDKRDLTTRRQLIAARSLAKQRSLQGADIVLKNLNNPNPQLRALAVLTLGDMLVPDHLERLQPAMEDPDDQVRLAAAAAVINTFVRATRTQ